MRCWVVAGLLVVASACGRTTRDSAELSTAGQSSVAAEGGAGATAMGGGGVATGGTGASAGSSAADGGAMVAATGGMAATGGHGALAGGGGDTASGGRAAMAGSGGSAGEAAAGAASACDGAYVACGCGCCGPGPVLPTACYYPELGDDLASIIQADVAHRKDAASCAAAGCSVGIGYACCVAPAPDSPGVDTYNATLIVGDLDRIRLTKTRGSSCAVLMLVRPAAGSPRFRIQLPTGWSVAFGTRQSCQMSAGIPSAIGGLGSFKLRVLATTCVVDADLTLFYAAASGSAEGERFAVTGLITDIPVAQCL